MDIDSRLPVGISGFFYGLKGAEKGFFAFILYLSCIHAGYFVNTFNAKFIASFCTGIAGIFRPTSNPQIGDPVIHPVHVDMVDIGFW